MTFRDISSGNRGRPSFKVIKQREERKSLDFTTENNEIYNKAFTEDELELALQRTKAIAPGLDCIHYKMLRDAYRRKKYLVSVLSSPVEGSYSNRFSQTGKEL